MAKTWLRRACLGSSHDEDETVQRKVPRFLRVKSRSRGPLLSASLALLASACASLEGAEEASSAAALKAQPCTGASPALDRDAYLLGGLPLSEQAKAHTLSLAAAYRSLTVVDRASPENLPWSVPSLDMNEVARQSARRIAEIQEEAGDKVTFRFDTEASTLGTLDGVDFWVPAPDPEWMKGESDPNLMQVIRRVVGRESRLYLITELVEYVQPFARALTARPDPSLVTATPTSTNAPVYLPVPSPAGGRPVPILVDSGAFGTYVGTGQRLPLEIGLVAVKRRAARIPLL